jgi:hypothetical protein
MLAALTADVSAKPLRPTMDPTYVRKTTGLPFADASLAPSAEPGAKWIWAAVVTNNQTIFARTAFMLWQAPKTAILYVTADDWFEVYLNGRKLGASPTSAADAIWKSVQRYLVTGLVTTGRNVIAVRAVNQGSAAGLLARLEVDGKAVLLTDEHWRVADKAIVPPEWNQAVFDDSSWDQATVIAPCGDGPWGRSLVGWPGMKPESSYMEHLVILPKSAQAVAGAARFSGIETLASSRAARVKILPDPSGSVPEATLLLDFGQELAGRLQVWGTAGAAVTISTGESEAETVHDKSAFDNSGPFKLTLAGAEPVSTPYSAFRYARLSFPGNTPVELTCITCDHKYYPVQYWGTFDCSDPVLTRIWYVGAYTAHLCMQEQIWDAPKRDRGCWIGDLKWTGETINDVFADRFLMERSIKQERDGVQGGHPAAELPASDINGVPGYSAAWFSVLADFYRHAGDREFLARQHENIVTLLKFQQTQFDEHDLFFNPRKELPFCDWVSGFVQDGPPDWATTQLYIIHGVRQAVYLLRELGDETNAAKFEAWANKLTTVARAKFADPATQTYGDRLQENVMAVLSDTATAGQCAEIYARVLRAGSPAWMVKRDQANLDDNVVMTPYYGGFVLQTLGKLDRHQDALDLIRRYWGDMLRRGATTWWEKFDPSWPEDGKWALDRMDCLSLCHGWSSGPTAYLTENVLGVRPTGAGFSTVRICPELGDLAWAEGDVPTPSGLIHVRVERKHDRLTTLVKLPPHVAATIQLAGKSLEANGAGSYRVTAP